MSLSRRKFLQGLATTSAASVIGIWIIIASGTSN